MAINLTAFTNNAADLEVMEHNERREGYSAGRAGEYFEDDLGLLEMGSSQGEDRMRGAYDWWPLTISGRPVGELRDDANGMTIHTQVAN